MGTWKSVLNFDRYEVSSSGEVRNKKTGRIKTNSVNSYGYFFVNLYLKDMNKPVPKTIHRIVAETFIPNIGETVNHKNGIKTDNRVENLEWISRAENTSHAWRTGLIPTLSGEKCGKSVLKELDIIEIRKMGKSGRRQIEIASQFNITQANVSAILKRLTWKHI